MIQGLLTVFLLAAFQQPAPPQPPAATYKVSGTVVREDKQDPAATAQANQIRNFSWISADSYQLQDIM